MSYKILPPEDEQEIREALAEPNRSSARDVCNSHAQLLLREIDMLRADLNYSLSKPALYPATTYIQTDSETYNAGRSEGNADVAAELRKIIDPEDKKHLNLTGALKEVENLVKYKEKAHEVIELIRETDALKEFAYSNDDGPSIAELLREAYYQGKGYKDNL